MTAAVAALSSACAVWAYSVQPMIYTLAPSGSGASTRLTVTNTRDRILNVEVEPFHVTAAQDGKRTFTPAPDDFVIFPPQASIQPDRVQVFQVRYIGPSALVHGMAYVLKVRQTNTFDLVRTQEGQPADTHLNLALNFNTTAIVQPASLRPDLRVEREPERQPDGLVHAIIRNAGTGIADLSRVRWTMAATTGPVALGADAVRYGDAVFLEAGAARDIVLPKDGGTGRLTVELAGDGRGQGAR